MATRTAPPERSVTSPAPAEGPARTDRLLRRVLLGTIILSVALLVFGTVAAYSGSPPIPNQVVGPAGQVMFTGQDIVAGKAVFQQTDLMDFGSLYGNGAYFGPDWGDDYLVQETGAMHDYTAQQSFGTSYAGLTAAQRSSVDSSVMSELRTNRYSNGTLTYTAGEVAAYNSLRDHYRTLFTQGDRQLGLQADVVKNNADADHLTQFFSWIAWTQVAQRPGASYSYTNNWPPEPAVGNSSTDAMGLWTWLSLAGLVVVGGLVVWAYLRLIAGHDLPQTEREESGHMPASPASVTPLQRSTFKWFLLVPALLLLQGCAGVLLAHYYGDRASFYGLDIRSFLPFNVDKAWHLQLAIAWVAAAWMAAGLFLGPVVSRHEPKYQRLLSNVLWVAVVFVVLGSAVGLWFGVRGTTQGSWFWFGNQGLEYIQIGRAFQIALFGGLIIWAALLARSFWPALRAGRSRGSIENLLLYSGVGIAFAYGFGMIPLTSIMDSATITDYWRWWLVHGWVENMFEFFTVAVIGYALLSMGLLSRRTVERTVTFELILILGSGLIGMGHHFYWAGEPAVWMGLGAMFSMLEVIPLGVMMVRAWAEYRAVRAAGRAFPQHIAFLFFTAAAVWNVLGAGLIGGLINPPLASYYEHGTFLTLAHAHASMFGVFGLLALGLVYFCVRPMTAPHQRSERLPRAVFWLFNAAIVAWLALNLVPIGIAQVFATIDHGFAYSRSLAFYNDWTLLQWARLPGDGLFLLAGVLLLWDLLRKLPLQRHIDIETVGSATVERVGRRALSGR